jgi:predicted DCC family thiol-disulfide oxidoreductase YuxK
MSDWDVEVFYDGDCPLCKREIAMLRRRDHNHRIRFTDIAAAEFDPSQLGLSLSTLMAEIHGRLPDGKIVVGVEVFRHLYTAIGFGTLVSWTRLPIVSGSLDLAYKFFAKQRLRLTSRRCNDECRVS